MAQVVIASARLAAVALLALTAVAHAQTPANVDDWQISGTVGTYRVGLDLIVEGD